MCTIVWGRGDVTMWDTVVYLYSIEHGWQLGGIGGDEREVRKAASTAGKVHWLHGIQLNQCVVVFPLILVIIYVELTKLLLKVGEVQEVEERRIGWSRNVALRSCIDRDVQRDRSVRSGDRSLEDSNRHPDVVSLAVAHASVICRDVKPLRVVH